MEVSDARQKVCQLQARLQVICDEFQKDTGLCISSVHIQTQVTEFGNRFPTNIFKVIVVI